jgi:menaquinone-specific isochorismate synthase
LTPPGDLAGLLRRDDITACWLRRGEGLVGLGERWRQSFATPEAADAWWAERAAGWQRPAGAGTTALTGVEGAGPVAFVSFPFDPGHTRSRCQLIVPQVVVGRRGQTGWLTSWGDPPTGLGGGHRLAAAESGATSGGPDRDRWPSGWDGRADNSDPASPGAVSLTPGAVDRPRWLAAVAQALDLIKAGQLDKVVLARDEIGRAERTIRPGWLLDRLQAAYPDTWTFAVAGLIGATPELLVSRHRGRIACRVLAGTIQRPSGVDAADLAQALSASAKDLAEHRFAVASVAQALAGLGCRPVVSPEPYVLRLPNVLHLASDLAATAPDTGSVIRLAAAIHPSAAVCGAPTDRAREAIRRLEGLDRGRYAGPVGWVGADGDGDIGLALRTGQLLDDRRTIRLYAGGGIVAGSDPAQEWDETEAKLLPLRQALRG